jgi:hypothetical protein
MMVEFIKEHGKLEQNKEKGFKNLGGEESM